VILLARLDSFWSLSSPGSGYSSFPLLTTCFSPTDSPGLAFVGSSTGGRGSQTSDLEFKNSHWDSRSVMPVAAGLFFIGGGNNRRSEIDGAEPGDELVCRNHTRLDA